MRLKLADLLKNRTSPNVPNDILFFCIVISRANDKCSF